MSLACCAPILQEFKDQSQNLLPDATVCLLALGANEYKFIDAPRFDEVICFRGLDFNSSASCGCVGCGSCLHLFCPVAAFAHVCSLCWLQVMTISRKESKEKEAKFLLSLFDMAQRLVTTSAFSKVRQCMHWLMLTRCLFCCDCDCDGDCEHSIGFCCA